VDILVF
jgi:hypothetical protein